MVSSITQGIAAQLRALYPTHGVFDASVEQGAQVPCFYILTPTILIKNLLRGAQEVDVTYQIIGLAGEQEGQPDLRGKGMAVAAHLATVETENGNVKAKDFTVQLDGRQLVIQFQIGYKQDIQRAEPLIVKDTVSPSMKKGQ